MGVAQKSLARLGHHQRHRRVHRLRPPAVRWSGDAGITLISDKIILQHTIL